MGASKYLFFFNPNAGYGKAAWDFDNFLSRNPLIARNSRTVAVSGLESVVAGVQNCSAEQIIISAGGDGTANMLAQALHVTGNLCKPFTLLPLGTGNALAHSIGIHSQDIAAHVLSEGKIRSMDVMLTDYPGKSIALISVSIGFEAILMGHREVWRKRKILKTVFSVMGAAFSRSIRETSVVIDGQQCCWDSARYFNIGFYAQPCLAFGRRIFTSNAVACVNVRGVVSDTPIAYWCLIAKGEKRCENFQPRGIFREWSTAVIATSGAVQIDGEPLDGRRITLRHWPQAMKIMVP